MTHANTPADPSVQPDYEQLGDAGNPLSGGAPTPDLDNAPGEQGIGDDTEQNAPLPDWGPTDGEHGTDNAPKE